MLRFEFIKINYRMWYLITMGYCGCYHGLRLLPWVTVVTMGTLLTFWAKRWREFFLNLLNHIGRLIVILKRTEDF